LIVDVCCIERKKNVGQTVSPVPVAPV